MRGEELLRDDLGRIEELERRVNEEEPDFLIGLHLESFLPAEADMEEIVRTFAHIFGKLPKSMGAHYKIDLSTVGLMGYANLYYVAPGMGGVFCYSYPLTSSEKAIRGTLCPEKVDSSVVVANI